MAKRITDEIRILNFFKTASQIEVVAMLKKGAAVADVRWPSVVPEKQKRGRTVKQKTDVMESATFPMSA